MIRGFVCGAFDLIHPGYVLMLKDAKSVCQHLTVGLHVDPSLGRPDKTTPIHSVEERRLILEAIKYVDNVVVYYTEADLAALLHRLKPDIRILDHTYQDKVITAPQLVPIYWHRRDHDYGYTALRQRIFETEYERQIA